MRVIIQPLSGRRCDRGDLISSIFIDEQELKTGLGGSGLLEAARGDVTEVVIAQTAGQWRRWVIRVQ